MRVRWSEEARRDLREIYRYRAALSVPGALAVLRAIRARAIQLEQFPDSGRRVPELANVYLRELIEGDYRILYERFADRVEIYAEVHGRVAFQDYDDAP